MTVVVQSWSAYICILSYYHKHMCQKSSNMKSFQHGDIPTFLPGFPCNFPCRVLRNPCLDASDHISGRLLNGWFEHVETLPIFDALLGYNVSPPMGKVGKTKTMYSWWVWDSGNGLFKSQSRLAGGSMSNICHGAYLLLASSFASSCCCLLKWFWTKTLHHWISDKRTKSFWM